MKIKVNRFLAPAIAAVVVFSSSAWAVDVTKADNTNNLDLGTSWDLGTAPGTGDVAVWDSTVIGANTVNLGANLTWGGLRIANPGGDVVIGGANLLTIGSSGLDTGSTRNLTLTNTGQTTAVTLSGMLAGSTALTLNSNTTRNWTGMTAVNFTGTLALRGGTGASGSFSNNWLAFGAASLTQTGAFHLDTGESLTNRGDFIITDGWGDGTTKPKLALASLTGFGDFRSDWGGTGNRTISVSSAGNDDFQGRIVQNNNSTRSIHFEKLGGGAQIFSGENAYQNTIVGAGKLQIGNGGATGNIGLGTVSVASGATLEFNRSGLLDYKASARMRNVSGSGDIVLDGGVKVFNYTGSGLGFDDANSWNNFSGDLIIKGGSEFQTIRNGRTAMGTAQVILGDATTSGTLSQIDGNWTWTNNIQLVGSANQIVNNSTISDRWNKLQGVISGDGNVTFSDSTGAMNNGNLGFILTGTNTLNGTLTVDTFVRVGGVTGDSVATTAGTGGTLGSADVVINFGKRLTFSRSDAHAVANTLSGAGVVHVGATGITGSNTQDLTLSGTNTYTGGTELLQGTLRVNALSGIGSNTGGNTGYLAVKNGATFVYEGTGSETTARNLFLDLGASNIRISDAGATLTWNDAAAKTGAFTKSGAGTLVLGGGFSGGASVTVDGGTLVLNGAGTQTGATDIQSGTLELGNAAALTNSSHIMVGATTTLDISNVSWTLGATQVLAGTGTVAGNAAIAGAINPGASAGALTINGNLNLLSGSLWNVEIGGTGLADFDRLLGISELNAGGSIALSLINAFNPALNDSFQIAVFGSLVNSGYSFDLTNAALADGLAWDTSSFDTSGVISVIPEPSTALLGGLGLLALLRRRRQETV